MATPKDIEQSATELVNTITRIPDPGMTNYRSVISSYKHTLVAAIALIRDLARNADAQNTKE